MSKAVRILLVFLVLSAASFTAANVVQAASCDPRRYQENPRLRKQKAREALAKAMELNAKVEIMLAQGSQDIGKMTQSLSQSYGYQITAINQMEGLQREACFKDPAIDKGILSMYEVGKPNTDRATSLIRMGDFAAAAEALANAKQAHRRYSILLY